MNNQEKLITEFLTSLGIDKEAITITQEDGSYQVDVDIKEDKRGIFIGHHASTLDSIQYLLALMLNNNLTDHIRITLDIGGYRQKRFDKIQEIVDRAKNQAKMTNLPVSIPRLTPTERRHVHVMLSEDDEFETHSEGEGSYRQLYITKVN